MSVASALERLAKYRAHKVRASQDIFETGSLIIKSGTSNLGDDGWEFLEQLALAAIDVGRLDVADQCIRQLSEKFPKSPRVDVLAGIRMESTESEENVLQYYQELLDEDATNTAAWKRQISVLRRSGKYDKAVEQLSRLLDIFYADFEGWLELADIYSCCHQYSRALESLSHALIIAPQNPFTFLQFAETAYTAGDLPLALKMYLVVVDMGEKDLPNEDPPMGICIRAWMGIKLCASRLMVTKKPLSPSNTPVSKRLNLIDELATERVMASYQGKQTAESKHVIDWLRSR